MAENDAAEIDNTNRTINDRITECLVWVKSSERDLAALREATKTHPVRLPQKAFEDFVIGIEKLTKAECVAAGFSWDKLEKDYGHQSLKLQADLIKKLLNMPLAKSLANTLQGQVSNDSEKVVFLSYNEAMNSLNTVKNRITVNKNRELSDWAEEWATLPEEKINALIKAQMKLYRSFKFGSRILSFIPIKFLLAHNVNSDFIGNKILKGMESGGFKKSEELRKMFSEDDLKSRLDKASEEEKLLMVKNAQYSLMSAWLIGALWVLTPLTSVHGMAFRYPGKPDSIQTNFRVLTESDYVTDLGIVASLRPLSKLADLISLELTKCAPTIAMMFFEPETKTRD